MSYVAALEHQYSTSERWMTGGQNASRIMVEHSLQKGLTARDVDQMIGHPLLYGETVYVAREIGDALQEAASSFPRVASLDKGVVQQREAFCFFERPLDCPESDLGGIAAMTWMLVATVPGGLEDGGARYHELTDEEFEAAEDKRLHAVTYCFMDGLLLPVTVFHLPLNMPISEVLATSGETVNTAALHRKILYLASLLTFMSQPFIQQQRETEFPRPTRRRLATWRHEHAVKVIKLRAAKNKGLEHQGKVVDWSCRWIVSGHWHLYHYKDGIRSRWVFPYPKGPVGKPLKLPRARVWAVVR